MAGTESGAGNAVTGSITPYSQLRSDQRINLAEAVPLAAPFTLHIEPTNICNFRCSYCPESLPEFERVSGGWHTLATAQIEHIYRSIQEFGAHIKTINFYMMGEPFAHPKLTAMIARARELNLANRLIVTSNASLLNAARRDPVIDCGLDYLRVSIYGGFEETHRERTQAKYSLAMIEENIKGLFLRRAERGAELPYIYVKMIDTGNAEENQRFLDRFTPISDEARIEPPMSWNSDIDSEHNWSGMEGAELLQSDYLSRTKEVCPFPFYNLIIHADLKVSVCCVDWSKKTVVGDLHEQSLMSIWRGDALARFQEMHLSRQRNEIEACRGCTYIYTAPDNLDKLDVTTWRARRDQQ